MAKEKEQRWLSRLRERIAQDDLAQQVIVTIAGSLWDADIVVSENTILVSQLHLIP